MRLGLMLFREFIRTIYHEAEIHESGAFERGKRLDQCRFSLASLESPSLKRLARNHFPLLQSPLTPLACV
jgi:hypothetical protein